MILKASQRSGGQNLGRHLLNAEDNEQVEVHEVSGFLSLFEEASAGTPFYQAAAGLARLTLDALPALGDTPATAALVRELCGWAGALQRLETALTASLPSSLRSAAFSVAPSARSTCVSWALASSTSGLTRRLPAAAW